MCELYNNKLSDLLDGMDGMMLKDGSGVDSLAGGADGGGGRGRGSSKNASGHARSRSPSLERTRSGVAGGSKNSSKNNGVVGSGK